MVEDVLEGPQLVTILVLGIEDVDHLVVVEKFLGSIHELERYLVHVGIDIDNCSTLLDTIMLPYTVIP